jgi:hypothetical protein
MKQTVAKFSGRTRLDNTILEITSRMAKRSHSSAPDHVCAFLVCGHSFLLDEWLTRKQLFSQLDVDIGSRKAIIFDDTVPPMSMTIEADTHSIILPVV